MYKHHNFTITRRGQHRSEGFIRCPDCGMESVVTVMRDETPTQKDMRSYFHIGREYLDWNRGPMKAMSCNDYLVLGISES